MNTKKDFENIIKISTRAPSGDNTQPWNFSINETTIKLFNTMVDESYVYDFRGIGTLVSLGAIIENIVITASHFGYESSVSLHPNKNDSTHIANIVLIKHIETKKDSLYPYITKRITNRKKYHDTPLSSEQKKSLINVPEKLKIGAIKIIDDYTKKNYLAKLLNNNEKLLFRNKLLHDGLFGYFRWTKKEADEEKDGLYVKTLEFSFTDILMLRFLKSWTFAKIFRVLGLSKIMSWKVARKYKASAAICAITVKGNSDEDFLNGGRVLERVWLKATQLGLSVQPAFGLVLLGQRVQSNKAEMFSSEQIILIKDVFKKLNDVFETGDDTIAMILRIGIGDNPSARSNRKIPHIIIEK